MRGVSERQAPSSRSEGAPYRHLAVRVIDQAFRDLADPAGSPADHESARAFLAGSAMLCHWCEIADINPTCMVARAGRLMAGPGRFDANPGTRHNGGATPRTRRLGATRHIDSNYGGDYMATLNGTIKRLVSDRGFGFIAAGDGNEYFFHQSACSQTPFDDLREGQAVTFERGQGPKGPRGENVKLV